MRAMVTGAAGFIGSTLVDTLLDAGHEVVAVDRFSAYYDTDTKRANLTHAETHAGFELHQADLTTLPVEDLIESVEVVYHLAAQPGVRSSWGTDFDVYQRDNVTATQRLLETISRSASKPRLVFASSSSVYGNADRFPSTEDDLPKPHSPYGVTKLAAEHLCRLYSANLGVSTISLRYFTVYGPRQRPDMAFTRLCDAALGGPAFPLYGDGTQIREFTYVSDVVAATVAAGGADIAPGTVINVSGGSHISMNEVIEEIGDLAGHEVSLIREGARPGDVRRTGGSVERARDLLGWVPRVSFSDGLARQFAYQRDAHQIP